MASYQFTRRTSSGLARTANLAEAMHGEAAGQTWLFVSPHDDDLCLGAGLLMQAAAQAGVEIQVAVVTDGCLGYCTLEQQGAIVQIRHDETLRSFAELGIGAERVQWLNYPDGGLSPYIGRRRARAGEEQFALEGYVGLQNALTHTLRQTCPARVFVPTPTDLHPDHRITHSELMISLFHAAGAIWPELGRPLKKVPRVGELAVYCDFIEPPDLEIQGDDEAFQAKLRSVEAYRSQAQIAALVAAVRSAGPVEYVHDVEFRLYSPDRYRPLFQ